MKHLWVLIIAMSGLVHARERAIKAQSSDRFFMEATRQELAIGLLYHGKSKEQRAVDDDFKRASRDGSVEGAITFIYGDVDRYDFQEVLDEYRIKQLPAYVLLRNTYDQKSERVQTKVVAVQAGSYLSPRGVTNFILNHFSQEMTRIRQEQVKQARLRAQQAEAQERERAARYPYWGWGGPYWGGPYYGYGPYYGGYWGGPYWGTGFGYYGRRGGVSFGVGF